MKKNYLIVMLALVCNFAMAQVQQTSYRGAFAPAPTTMWTNGWTNFDPNNAVYGAVTTVITGDITASTTWVKTNVYELRGIVTVRNNATLTIPAGTVIRSNVTASCLVITRGAKLIANGTAAEPIVFTSANAAGSRSRGNWGGIVLLGKARYNINNGVNFIEGLSQNVNTEFGGGTSPIDTDNSGSLKYVRIEYAGFVFGANNELNGLTMGAVGSGTTVDYVQVSYSNDDSFEWFGGSVNCSHLVAFAGLDDDFDTDNGYKGICQYGLSVKDPLAADISTSECFESDNNGSAAATTVSYGDFTSAIFTNYTCIGANRRPTSPITFETPNSFHDKGLRIRRASQLKVFNSIFMDFKAGLVINDALTQGYAASTGELKFRNNTIVTTATTGVVGSSPTTSLTGWYGDVLKDNRTLSASTSLLARAYGTISTNYNLITDNNDMVNLDYRPSSADAFSAAFTDSSLSGLLTAAGAPGVSNSNRTYCKGAVAPVLTANLSATGVSLLWHTVATGGVTASQSINGVPAVTSGLASITPSTTAVGPKTYYVSELDATGVESARASVVVTTLASPVTALGTITSTVAGFAATAVVTPYIRTATAVTYTVPVSSEAGVTYLWTVPLGVNILPLDAVLRPNIGQGFNTIVVNYLDVPLGTLKVGNIAVQAVNAGGCPGAIKTLAITAVLPVAPAALVMNDGTTKLNSLTNVNELVKVTSFAKYMGTNTSLTLTATPPVVTPDSYVWQLPAGVNLLTALGNVVSTDTKNYTTYPFTVPFVSPSGTVTNPINTPTNPGNVYYNITVTTYSTGIIISTGRIITIFRAATGNLPAVVASNIALGNVTPEGVTVNPSFPIVQTPGNVISVDFAGVTSANTFNYLTTATTPVSTNIMRIGVQSRNATGVSKTSNATAINPATNSEAKLLTLKATAPAAPGAIKMTDGSSTTAVTVVSRFVGTTTPFTLTATPSLLASSYSWELPTGVNLVSAPSSLSTNVITVNFAGVAPGTTALYIGVKGVNGIGSSVTTNVAPNALSTFKYLKLTAAVAARVYAVTGQIAGVCGGSPYSYTITPSLLATSYVITAPSGSIVTSPSNLGNTASTLTTTDLTFTVVYPAGFVATVGAPKTLAVAAANGVGTSANKTYTLSTLMPALGVATPTSYTRAIPVQITIAPLVGAVSYNWTLLPAGAVILNGQGTNSVLVDFAAVSISLTTLKLSVTATNACGVSTAIKAITLSNAAAGTRVSSITKGALTVSTTEVYPNPVSGDYNIDVTASKAGALEISVYSLDGTLIVNPKSVQLQQGANTISENISDLNSGIYILQLVNSSNNEVITKKLIKN